MISARKKTSMKYGAVFGTVAGVAIFAMAYTVNNSLAYLLFIPFAAAIGWVTQYVKDEDKDD
ncbi:MAG: hypothetical protein LBJ20_01615 [Candidatus Methanoplasma sp.]|jgi:4-hydroxybenzoate polyprenyltransferase|nr:hypothetical protein [Candidatus Methanoplasma sp.]